MKKYSHSVINSILAGVLICGMLAACGEAGKNFTSPEAPEKDPNAPTYTQLSSTSTVDEQEKNSETEAEAPAQEQEPETEEEGLPIENETAKKIIETARDNLGVKYTSNGKTPEDGFDSSGLVFYCFKEAGIDVPRRVKDQITDGETVGYDELKPGDIAFFSVEEGGKANFCGIYAGGGLIIYSPAPGGSVKTANITTSYWTARFVSGARYISD